MKLRGKSLTKMTRRGTCSGGRRRWQKAMTDDVPAMDAAAEWLANNQPAESGATLIHNDFKYDNFVLDPADWRNIVAVLDWEMATVGDPLMDLGNSLAYWIQADDEPQFQMMRRQPTHERGMLSRREVVEYYLEKTGLNVPVFDFYEVYGLFRLAVIIQQIYYRYYHGQTKDKRFAGFASAAAYLEQRSLALISGSKL